MRRSHFLIVAVLLVCGCASNAELKAPHTLLFSPIVPEYLQDTANEWKATGYDGFLLANVMRNWSDDVWTTDGESGTRGDDDQTLPILTPFAVSFGVAAGLSGENCRYHGDYEKAMGL